MSHCWWCQPWSLGSCGICQIFFIVKLLFPFVINKCLLGIYFEDMLISCYSEKFSLTSWAFIEAPCLRQVYYAGCQIMSFQFHHPFCIYLLFGFLLKESSPFPFIDFYVFAHFELMYYYLFNEFPFFTLIISFDAQIGPGFTSGRSFNAGSYIFLTCR